MTDAQTKRLQEAEPVGRPYDPAQEAAWRDWWDNRRTEEHEALANVMAVIGKERMAFRAGWLAAHAALQSQEPTP